jgi:tRNA/rRNA methyltransferase
MDIFFILVEPAVPENIGASARAINTMGFHNLRLVNPKHFPHEKATWLAHGSTDILEHAALYDHFDEAIADLDFVIATTAKKRGVKHDFYPLDAIQELISNKGSYVKRLGVVFGREESGLKNKEIRACHLVSYIPMQSSYPSLNLAQAVMLYAHHLSRPQRHQTSVASLPQSHRFKTVHEHTKKLLDRIGIPPEDAKHGRILERISLLSEPDLHLLLSVTHAIESRL